MTTRPRKPGINLGNAFAAAGNSIVKTAEASMPSYAQHVADTKEIAPNPLNARKINPKSADIQQLAKSLKKDGQLQGIPVVPRADFLSWEGFDKYAAVIGAARYVVIGGGRRRAAAEVAGLARMDISIKPGMTRETFLRLTIVENIERLDLTPLEEAHQIKTLRDATGDSYAEIGELLNGRTKGWVGQRLDLLNLSERLQAELASDAPGSMTVTQARELLKAIRREVGDEDDASVSAGRQWELWEALRDAERLPRKRDDEAKERLPRKQDADLSPAVAANRPGAQVANGETRRGAAAAAGSATGGPAAVPSQPAGRDHGGQGGAVLLRVDVPAADIVHVLRDRMPPAKWAEFVAEVNAS
ncbi:ParB/RepB/Spo0J family partition protein [Paractinoplanes atraurantiacus]|uniref:ParB/RepB/Spo0J family partition protein n=1 Tax=Paractinoplanes atraurantiacus TaxID=1036182 RepID=A0A285KJK4_9ACTN|nr:ParB/RepB/Spo0J family partition protein [Actinoplanes atraurantiacus]SNY72814.1 ParB/RepB/Spo0J family partition protein [Actinoplanes atraurantiacus]